MEGYQIQSIIEMLIVTSGTLTGLWIVARAWAHRRSPVAQKEVGRLTESVEKMRESVDHMREDLMDVSERLEFTERMLARLGDEGKPRQQLKP